MASKERHPPAKTDRRTEPLNAAREDDVAPTVVADLDGRLRLPLAIAQAAALVGLALGAGAALQYSCDAGLFGLQAVRLGPAGGAADALFAPAQASGDATSGRSWRLLPLAALNLLLFWDAAPRWTPDSAYASMDGPLTGQLVTLVTCGLSVLPAVLAGWLLCLPMAWTPITLLLSLALLQLAPLAALFWTSALPLLPRARVSPACARAAVRRSLILLASPVAFSAIVATAGDAASGRLVEIATQGPAAIAGGALEEVRGMSETGSAVLFGAQFLVALLGILVVMQHGA
jgi:hypothetical protein